MAHGWHDLSRIADPRYHRHIHTCRCDVTRILLPRFTTATPGRVSSPPPWRTVQPANGVSSSLAHLPHSDLGSGPVIQAPSSDGAFFSRHGPTPRICRKCMADVPSQRLCGGACRTIVGGMSLRPLLLPGRALHGLRLGGGPKAPLIPSSGAFLFSRPRQLRPGKSCRRLNRPPSRIA